MQMLTLNVPEAIKTRFYLILQIARGNKEYYAIKKYHVK